MSKTKVLEISEEGRNDLYISLSMRCGFIETGTINRAKDLRSESDKRLIKALTVDQMKAIIRMEELMSKLI